MISNPSLVYYACIAQNQTILGEIAKEPGIETLAQKCLEQTPRHHSMYTHTVRSRCYLFLIGEPFVFFGVFDQALDQSEAVAFLDRLRCDFERVNKGEDNVVECGPRCYQAEFDSIAREIMGEAESEMEMQMALAPLVASRSLGAEPSSSSGKGKRMVLAPLLGLKKKKRLSEEMKSEVCRDMAERNVDVGMCEDGREFATPVGQKSGLVSSERQKAKQVWRKHVWVVLMLDLFVCAVLFGVWLWVCRGLKCIDS